MSKSMVGGSTERLIQSALVEHGGLTPDDPGYRGQADYTPNFLAYVYDPLVLKFVNRFIWRLPTPAIQRLYDTHLSAAHLDVGPATGYLLDNCQPTAVAPAITLLDVNPNVLDAASRRIARYRPRLCQADLLQPLDIELGTFGSIGLTHVLHCLPGTIKDKAVVIEQLRPLLRPGGALFGTTILGAGVRHTPWSKALLWFLNTKGVMSNRNDDAEALDSLLAANFDRYSLSVRGTVAVFVCHA
ncbi:MAG: class I SAM-dependent methyltransferase [Nakamurella sp.]